MDRRGLREVLEVSGRKWDLAILIHLHERPLRYTDLKIQIRDIARDLSEGVLSKSLKQLMTDGLVLKRSIGDHHHVWALTCRGRQMIVGLAQQIIEAQTKTDSTGEQLAAGNADHPCADADAPAE